MTTYAASRGGKPARVVTLQPDAFADAWELRPRGPTALGLRLLSEDDYETATIEAAKYAVDSMHDAETGKRIVDEASFEDVYNGRIMVEAIARAICNPGDARENHASFPFPQDQLIAGVLTPETIRFLWDEMSRMRIELSPITPKASDADLARLAAHLGEGSLARLPSDERAAARKLLSAVLERLDAAAPGVRAAEPPQDEDDEDLPTYLVTATG